MYMFIHSSVDGHLGCFCVLAIVNSAGMGVGGCMSVFTLELSWHICLGNQADEQAGVAGLSWRESGR